MEKPHNRESGERNAAFGPRLVKIMAPTAPDIDKSEHRDREERGSKKKDRTERPRSAQTSPQDKRRTKKHVKIHPAY